MLRRQQNRDLCGHLGVIASGAPCPGCESCCTGFVFVDAPHLPRRETAQLEQPHFAAREVAREQARVVRRNRWS